MKKFFFATLITFLSLEFISRVLIFLLTLNISVFTYGIDKKVSFNVIDLSSFKFSVISEKKSYKSLKKIHKKDNKEFLIWVFGGSTTEGFEPGCGHSTSSWPIELDKLDPKIKVVNYGKAGSSSDYALKKYFESRSDNKPDYILWANKINEEFNAKVINSNRYSIFFLKIYKTLKTNLIFFNLYDDLIKKINIYVFKKNIKMQRDMDLSKFWGEAIDSYNRNTSLAINLSNFDGSYFYIVSLFTEYNFDTNQFHRKSFFDIWEKNAKKLKDKYKIDYIDTENLVIKNMDLFDSNKKYFCNKDKIHQSILGNQITAKLIYDYIFD